MDRQHTTTQNGVPPDPSEEQAPTLVVISPTGDVVLDVTFDTSRDTLKSTRKSIKSRPGIAKPTLKGKIRLGFRVQLATLKKQSRYFENLLSDSRFQEAKTIADAFAKLSLSNVKPEDADVEDLPWVEIVDDDEATRSAGREAAFGDLMRILHGKETTTKPPTMPYVVVLAVLADRFDCTAPVSRYLNSGMKFKWPASLPRSSKEDAEGISKASEELIRQKILVSWLLDQPTKLYVATRELITYGSSRWCGYPESETNGATWWDLPDDLERELQYRRECIMNTIASALQHFLGLYTSRTGQCKLGYESSGACDSFQLGEMVKFLVRKNLLYLVDFSPASAYSVPDSATLELGHILTTLKQCPSYQIDKHHTNCGLRNRILPIAEYIQTMLSSNVIAISRVAWKKTRSSASWIPTQKDQADGDEKEKTFRFTRLVAGDQRLRFEGAMAADRLARELFTAQSWDWTPEY